MMKYVLAGCVVVGIFLLGGAAIVYATAEVPAGWGRLLRFALGVPMGAVAFMAWTLVLEAWDARR